MMQNGEGGCPIITSGGAGFHDVSLTFISQRSQGMEFNVEIWGTPDGH